MRFLSSLFPRQQPDTSQHGEAMIMRSLVRRDWPRVLVDVGAHDGRYLSNSYPFIRQGWRAILIEPHPTLFRKLKALHAGNPLVSCVEKACTDHAGPGLLYQGKGPDLATSTLSTENSGWLRATRTDISIPVACDTLTNILEEQGCPQDFGILCIDAETMDYEVLLGLDLSRFRPRMILTEEYSSAARKGPRKHALLAEKGYELRARTGPNTLWLLAPTGA